MVIKQAFREFTMAVYSFSISFILLRSNWILWQPEQPELITIVLHAPQIAFSMQFQFP